MTKPIISIVFLALLLPIVGAGTVHALGQRDNIQVSAQAGRFSSADTSATDLISLASSGLSVSNPSKDLLDKLHEANKPKEKPVTWQSNPNHCSDAQYIALEPPHYCIDRKQPVSPKTASRRVYVASGNTFDYHSCTWHVKTRRPDVPNSWSDAIYWLSRAKADGWATGSAPRVGAIGWTYGHVVYIERLEGNRVYISERNYDWRGSYRERWASASSFTYIY